MADTKRFVTDARTFIGVAVGCGLAIVLILPMAESRGEETRHVARSGDAMVVPGDAGNDACVCD